MHYSTDSDETSLSTIFYGFNRHPSYDIRLGIGNTLCWCAGMAIQRLWLLVHRTRNLQPWEIHLILSTAQNSLSASELWVASPSKTHLNSNWPNHSCVTILANFNPAMHNTIITCTCTWDILIDIPWTWFKMWTMMVCNEQVKDQKGSIGDNQQKSCVVQPLVLSHLLQMFSEV